jgi:hypothetical protein
VKITGTIKENIGSNGGKKIRKLRKNKIINEYTNNMKEEMSVVSSEALQTNMTERLTESSYVDREIHRRKFT